MFNLKFSSNSKKFLVKTNNDTYKRLLNKINELCHNPFPNNSKRIVNVKPITFRIRVGKYRILYLVDLKDNVLLVWKIDKRSKIYK